MDKQALETELRDVQELVAELQQVRAESAVQIQVRLLSESCMTMLLSASNVLPAYSLGQKRLCSCASTL